MKRARLCVYLVFAITAISLGQSKPEAPAERRPLRGLRAIVKEQKREIRALKDELKEMRHLLDRERKASAQLVLYCDNHQLRVPRRILAQMINPPLPMVAPNFRWPLSIGQVAWADRSFRVSQVIDANNMIIGIADYGPAPHGEGRQIKSKELINIPAMSLGSPKPYERTPLIKKLMWLRGVNTAGFINEGQFFIDVPLEVVGTKTYKTVLGGSNTIPVLEPFVLDPDVPPG